MLGSYPVRVLFCSSGVAGSGHVALGLSLGNALRRRARAGRAAEAEYRLVCVDSPFAPLASRLGFDIVTVPPEGEAELGPGAYEGSALYRAIVDYAPDLLVVDLFWFPLDSFIASLPCRKVLLIRQVDPRFFTLPLRDRELRLRPGDYDLVLRTEPCFETPFPSEEIDPIIILDRGEIMGRDEALADLGLAPDERACLFAFNGAEGEGALAWKSFSYLEDEGWRVVRSDNRSGGLFPAARWFNAFDLVVCGAGYSAFWEARYFGKEACFVPYPRRFEDQGRRVALFSDYTPTANGADKLVDRLTGL